MEILSGAVDVFRADRHRLNERGTNGQMDTHAHIHTFIIHTHTHTHTHTNTHTQAGTMKLTETLLQIFVTNALSCALRISQDIHDVIYTSLRVNFSRFHSVLFLLKLLHDSSFNCSTNFRVGACFLSPLAGDPRRGEQAKLVDGQCHARRTVKLENLFPSPVFDGRTDGHLNVHELKFSLLIHNEQKQTFTITSFITVTTLN
jgi:hypothetical protein